MKTLEAVATSLVCESVSGGEVAALLCNSPLRPYDSLAATFSEQNYREFCEGTVQAILGSRHARASMLRWEESVASACWSYLPFDSEHLEVQSARVDWLLSSGTYPEARKNKARLLVRVREQCRGEGIQYLIARVHAIDYSTIHALEENGFELIDGIQRFAKNLPAEAEHQSSGCAFPTRLYRPEDLDSLLAIARSSYTFDRFHSDEYLSKEAANRVNERWVENSCLGTAADAVVVALDGSKPAGYVTCKVDRQAEKYLGTLFGSIGMVATDPNLRGRGIARAATRAALEWFSQQGVSLVEVGTQLGNIPASRLYETCGFQLVSNSLTFRKLLS